MSPVRDSGAYCYTSGMKVLLLGTTVLQSIRSHAEQCYPEEACGLLLGRSQEHVVEALPMANQAEDRRRAYLIDPEDYLRNEYHAEDRGFRIIGVWHTHPDGKPEPSVTDTRMAWPDWHYLIAAVQDGRMGAIRAWILNEGSFQEEVINP